MKGLWLVAALTLGLACGTKPPPPPPPDGGGLIVDAGTPDAGTDSGTDGGPTDGGATDGGAGDAGTPDAGVQPEAKFELPPLQTTVPTFKLTIPEETLEKFAADPYLDEQPATLEFDGKSHAVTVRLRGGSSRWYPKRSWRIELPDGDELDGRRKINLVAEQADRTLMVEKLAYDLLAAMHAPAPKASYAQLYINGRYEGVYLDIERVDGKFTKRNAFPDKDATIYRAGNQDSELKLFRMPYQGDWEKENNEDEPGRADLDAFLRRVNRSGEPAFAEELAQVFDVDSFVKSMANDALISNDIMMDAGDYLIHDRVTDRWTYVPWDYNNSASRWWPTYGLGATPFLNRPMMAFTLDDARVKFFYEVRATRPDYLPAFNVLATRVVRDPVLRAKYVAALQRALDELFTEAKLHPRIAAMHKLIAPLVAQDPYVNLDTEGKVDPDGLAKFQQSEQYLKDYVTGRITFLKAELAKLRARKLGLAFEAVDPNARSITLRNFGETAVDLSPLVVTSDLRRAKDLSANLPARSLAPGERLTVTSSELGISMATEGELGIFTQGAVWGPADVIFYGTLPAGQRYLRSESADHGWTVAK